MTDENLEHLDEPPIVEVACGIVFERIDALDPVTIGIYANSVRRDYPVHQLQPAVLSGNFVAFGPVPPLRVLLISADDATVIQIQSDRLYMNWRARSDAYPRFSDRNETTGLLTRALHQFEGFCRFAEDKLRVRPRVTGIDLAKVDHLVQHRHWTDFSDLAACLPWFGKLAEFSNSHTPTVAVRFQEEREGGTLSVSVATSAKLEGDAAVNILGMEARIIRATTDAQLRETFIAANRELNQVFMKMIPSAERRKRFNQGGVL